MDNTTRYRIDPEYRLAVLARRKKRYAEDAEFRAQAKARSLARYNRLKDDPEFRRAHVQQTQAWRIKRAARATGRN